MEKEKIAKEVLNSNLKEDVKIEILRILFENNTIQYYPYSPIVTYDPYNPIVIYNPIACGVTNTNST